MALIDSEQLVDQLGSRPAIEQQMVIREDERMPGGAQPQQRAAPQGWFREHEAQGTVGRHDLPSDRPLRLWLELRQILDAPRDRGAARNHLERRRRASHVKGSTQVRGDDRAERRPTSQPLDVERSLNRDRHLDGIDIGGRVVVQRVEQQSFLQRRQWKDVLQVGVRRLQLFDRPLRDGHQREIRRRVTTRSRVARVLNNSLEGSLPERRESVDLRRMKVRRRPRPRGVQPWSIRRIDRDGVDIEEMKQRHRGIDAASKAHHVGHRRPVGPGRRGQAAEIVESQLRSR